MNLELVKVTYGYHPHTITVREASLSPPGGRITGIAGPNGAGKSTLLKLAAGILPPRSGRVLLDGVDASDYDRREYARRVTWVPEETSIPFPLRVREIVETGRYPYLQPFRTMSRKDERAVDRALVEMDVEKYADELIHALSSGEKQRVMLARALAAEADTMLLDEPFAHLDPDHQARTARKIVQMRDDGRTVLLVSHQVNLLISICDVIHMMTRGELVETLESKKRFTDARAWERLFGCPFSVLTGEQCASLVPVVDGAGSS